MSAISAALASPSLGGRAHPRLEHASAVGQLLDAVDRVAPAFGRQPDHDSEPVRPRRSTDAARALRLR